MTSDPASPPFRGAPPPRLRGWFRPSSRAVASQSPDVLSRSPVPATSARGRPQFLPFPRSMPSEPAFRGSLSPRPYRLGLECRLEQATERATEKDDKTRGRHNRPSIARQSSRAKYSTSPIAKRHRSPYSASMQPNLRRSHHGRADPE